MRLAETLTTNAVVPPYPAGRWTATTATWMPPAAKSPRNLKTRNLEFLRRDTSSVSTTSDTGLQREQVGGIVVGIGGLIVLVALLWCVCIHRGRRRPIGDGDSWSPPPPRPRPPRPWSPQPLPPGSRPPTEPTPPAVPVQPRPNPPSGPIGSADFIYISDDKPQDNLRGPDTFGPPPETGTHFTRRPKAIFADTAYRNADSQKIVTKKGHMMVVAKSNNRTRVAGFARRGFSRRARHVPLPPEGITPLGNHPPGNATVVSTPEEPEIIFRETVPVGSRSPGVARATNHDNKHELEATATAAATKTKG